MMRIVQTHSAWNRVRLELRVRLPSPAATTFMAKTGNAIHIPLPEAEAIRLALRVKPTADMPKPGGARYWAKEETEQR